jgi:hypothetical protein
MKIPKLRDEIEREQVLKIIKKISKNSGISLWQNLEKSRYCEEATLVKVPHDLSSLVFYPKDKNQFSFASKDAIYFYEKSLCLIFKAKIIFNAAYEVHTSFPELVMLKELRLEPRSKFNSHAPPVKLLLENASKGREVFYQRPGIDFSESGLSFKISKEEAPIFLHSQFITIMAADDSEDENESIHKTAKICHVSSYEDTETFSKNFLQVGVSFVDAD